MKNRIKGLKVVVVFVLCLVMVAGCASDEIGNKENIESVATMEAEESKAVSFGFIGGKDVMPITGYYGPFHSYQSTDGNAFPNYVSDEYMKMIADAGLNMIVYNDLSYARTPELAETYLDLADKYGLGIFVNDTKITGYAGKTDISPAELAEQIARYADHDCFCGMYLIDEPGAAYYEPGNGKRLISRYVELADVLHNDLGLITYINMFPIWDYEIKKESYEKYVKEVCESLNPKVLMWDMYPFDSAEGAKEGYQVYFYNMNLIREYSKKMHIPFWAFIQAGHQWNDAKEKFDSKLPYYPNESQFQWNVNTSLAFGAQGIQYFPILQPEHFAYAKSTEWDFQRNGLIGANGNKNQWYYYAQNINKHIAAIDEVLMNSVHKGIIITSEQAQTDMELAMSCVIESGEFQELLSVTGDAMVGCFNYSGKTALYVVNYDMEHAQNITLNLNTTHDVKVIQNTETSYVNAKNLKLDMAAGEGVLVVIEQ